VNLTTSLAHSVNDMHYRWICTIGHSCWAVGR